MNNFDMLGEGSRTDPFLGLRTQVLSDSRCDREGIPEPYGNGAGATMRNRSRKGAVGEEREKGWSETGREMRRDVETGKVDRGQ